MSRRALPPQQGQQQGQAVLITVGILAVISALAFYLFGQFVVNLGHLHNRTRYSILLHATLESMGLELRRAFDMYDVPSGTCPGGYQARQVGGFRLCLLNGADQLCLRHPASPAERFCASFALFVASSPSSPEKEVQLEARVDLGLKKGWIEDILDQMATSAATWVPLGTAHAQRSDHHRPPAPTGVAPNTLAAPPAAIAITCGVNADCLTIRVCDTSLGCSVPTDFTSQRFAFPR